MFTENKKALTYIPSALFLYLPKITSFLFLLLKFYWIPDNNHKKTQMLTALNYTADNQHNLRNWNDALIKAPVLKRQKNKTKHIFLFFLRSCPEISFLKLPTPSWNDILNPISHCKLRNLGSEALENEQLFICEPGGGLVSLLLLWPSVQRYSILRRELGRAQGPHRAWI